MSRLFVSLFVFLFLFSYLPSSYALLADCVLEGLQLERSFTSPPAPVVQNPPNQLLGFPLGYSPFFNEPASTNPTFTQTPLSQANINNYNSFVFNPLINVAVNGNGGISNNRIWVNFTVGDASTVPFFPNSTVYWNGVPVINCLPTYFGATFIPTAVAAGPCTNAQGDIIQVYGSGNVLLGLTPVLCGNNTLIFNSSGFAQTTGTDSCTGFIYAFNISNPGPCNATSIVGDPQFLGLRGQSFQVHGIDGAVYNIISDKQVQVNSRFAFLNGPRVCPIMPSTGKKSPSCWSHPGSYLGEIGIVTSGGDRLFIKSGAAISGFAIVTLNDEQLTLNNPLSLTYANTTETTDVRVISSHEVSITAGPFIIELENIDSFLNLRSVAVRGSIGKLESHGLLGQTWQNKRYLSTLKVIEGEVDDYVITNDDIFGSDFIYNQFSA